MLKISKLADYATVIMSFFAENAGSFSASAIAEQTGVKAPTATKVLKALQEAGLLISKQGAHGGYQLAKQPQQISVIDIIAAIDGKPAITECTTDTSCCSHESDCQLRDNWQYINQVIEHVLAKISLADMNDRLHTKPLQFFESK